MKKKKWPFIYVAVITILTYIPILLTVVYSFNASKLTSVWEGFSLKWYRELFRDRDLGEALINSLILAVLSCTFAVLIGTSGALGMSRRKRKLNEAVAYVSTLPIMIPEIILGMVFLSVFSLMGLPFGMVTLVIAHTTFACRIFYDGKGEAGGNGPFPGRSGLGPGSVEMAGIPGRDTSADPAGDPVRGTAGICHVF